MKAFDTCDLFNNITAVASVAAHGGVLSSHIAERHLRYCLYSVSCAALWAPLVPHQTIMVIMRMRLR